MSNSAGNPNAKCCIEADVRFFLFVQNHKMNRKEKRARVTDHFKSRSRMTLALVPAVEWSLQRVV